MQLRRWIVVGLLGGCGVVAACGSSDDASPLDPTRADGGAGASSSSGGIAPNDGGNSSGGDSGYAQCATSTLTATRDPLRVAVALDKSNSLCQTPGDGGANCDAPDSLRAAVWNAMKAFFESPSSAGVQASLVGFAGGTCDKQMPATRAPVDLPDVAHLLAGDLDGPDFVHEAGTQTMAGIASARRILRQLPEADDRKSAVLLVTDGVPTKCPGDDTPGIDLAVDEVKATKKVGIPVYVIGVASYKNDNSVELLDQLAAAAGTNGNHAVRIDQGTPAEVTARLLTALDKIRNVELSCEVPLPAPPAGQTLDPNLVNVQLTTSAGAVDASQSDACADPHGWRYEQVDGGETKLLLCPDLCEQSKAPDANVNVILGCATRTSNPN